MDNKPQPLAGIRVVDFSTLLPGPMCTLLLAEAGAEVWKIERPGIGDEMRSYVPKFGTDSVNFALLNRGKRSVALDLKSVEGQERALELIVGADVLVEQFRGGVMARLGLGADELLRRNPRLVYCSISGYGQSGPLSTVAAHDLNYIAQTGMLNLSAANDGAPVLPPALVADLAGGAYPALINILLALRQREKTGLGSIIDVSMADNLFTLMYWALGNGFAAGQWPRPGGDLVTGGTHRYNVYRTQDGRWLAAAPLEEKFWANFVTVLEAPHLLDDSHDPQGVREEIARRIESKPASYWQERFENVDACVNVVQSLQEAVNHPHFAARGIFSHRLDAQGADASIPALPVPVARAFRRDDDVGYPQLGEAQRAESV